MESSNYYDAAKMAQEIFNNIQKEYKQMNRFNIMILGKTGVGKSTLINSMFNEELAPTGVGQRVTEKISEYTVPDSPLAIYDTPGLELGGKFSFEALADEVVELIKNKVKTNDINKVIHCIWYCVATPSARFEEYEEEFLKRIYTETSEYNLPIIIVLTKSYFKKDTDGLIKEIQLRQMPFKNIVPVLAQNYDDEEDDFHKKAFGLDRLAQVTYECLQDDGIKKTFSSIQCANLDLKIRRAHAIVAAAATTAAATGAVPIPFSDAALLVPEQIAMLGSITAAFGISMEKGTIMTIITSTIGTVGTTVLGKTVVSGLLKLIPGVGSAAGGVISGATAAALTTALGETYIIILTQIFEGKMSIEDIGTDKGKKMVNKIFLERMKVKRDKTGEPKSE